MELLKYSQGGSTLVVFDCGKRMCFMNSSTHLYSAMGMYTLCAERVIAIVASLSWLSFLCVCMCDLPSFLVTISIQVLLLDILSLYGYKGISVNLSVDWMGNLAVGVMQLLFIGVMKLK